MVLESTMICLDNSEWMRNGDYTPTRLAAQQDAAGLLCNDRTNSNRENSVGVLAMAGQGVELLVSPTDDIGKILACFARVKVGGKSDFVSSVQIAQLALKHRKNKNGGQRIIAFIGSPISDSKDALSKIAKQLKKNNVAVDIVNLGEVEDNQEKLLEFINTVNSNDNSHLITVPPGVLPSDAIMSSSILQDTGGYGGGGGAMNGAEGGAAGGGGAGGNFDDYGGIDPSMDPELAMAIRVSTEEARAHEEARAKAAMEASREGGGATAAQAEDSAAASSSSSSSSSSAGAAASPQPAYVFSDEDEEALMQRALELSMRDISQPTSSCSSSTAEAEAAAQEEAEPVYHMTGDEEEEEALRMALELSMSEGEEQVQGEDHSASAATSSSSSSSSSAAATAPPAAPASEREDELVDSAFLSQLLGSVDVDLNDPLIMAALAQLTGASSSNPPPPPGAGDASASGEPKKRKNDERDSNS